MPRTVTMTATGVESSGKGDVYKQLDKFGKFQVFQYILICLPLMMVSMINVNYIFVAEDVEHRQVLCSKEYALFNFNIGKKS